MNRRFEEKPIDHELKFSGKIFSAFVDRVELSDGRKSTREYVVHGGGSGILPIDDEGGCYLVSQWRYPYEGEILEIPAGKRDKDEDPYDTAVRELEEEVGFKARRIIDLGCIYPSPAYVRERLHIFIATGLTPVGAHLDEGEFLEIVKLPLEEAIEMVMKGEIHDAKTQIALLKAKMFLKRGQ